MANSKISALSSASTPLAGTEVLPIVQSSATVKVSVDNLTVKNIRSNATSGLLQVVGPAAASTRVMTTPDANFSAARIDAGQTFVGAELFNGNTGATSDPFSSGATQVTLKSGTSGTTSVFLIGGLTAYYAIPFGSNVCDANGFNAAATANVMGYHAATTRSLNAGGTVNALGTDYAEYMTKSGDFTVAKGDVVGIDAQGKLTNVFADAVSFVVKSTNPSFVGGDAWGSVDAVGLRPNEESSQAEKDAYEAALEAARQTVDRIAFAGQVPVNVLGATAGQYIIAINDNGAIKGQAVSNPTFEQYQQAVGKVIALEDDGRAKIIVKVA
jgi:hypothetical protein